MSLGDIGIGIGAALRSPRWIAGSQLNSLVREAQPLPVKRDPALATRTSALAVKVLARIPFTPWRNTCLYRSVAECLALRRCGVPARLRLGVARGSETDAAIAAHAWVERPSEPGANAEYVPLSFDR